VALAATITGVAARTAEVMVAEIGTDMTVFPPPGPSRPGPVAARATTNPPTSEGAADLLRRGVLPLGAAASRSRR
jgi:hypothetical protein